MRYVLTETQLSWAEETWEKLLFKLSEEEKRIGSAMPYISVNGRYEDMGEKSLTWWTNGFWGGILWQLYHATGEKRYAEKAKELEERFDRALSEYERVDHDLGFMWLHTAVADYRLTQDPLAKVRGLHAAALLASRFQPAGEYFRAWNQGPSVAIIDCMMNLPLLYWGSEVTGNPAWKQLAMKHADTALTHILRADGSSNHIVVFDQETGECLEKPGGQGYGKGSAWTRGQAWAIYGMSLSYRYTGKTEYLDAAKRCAHFFIANAAMNEFDVVIDFRAPSVPVYYDNIAAACAACGLLELSEFVPECEKHFYVSAAIRLLQRLTERFCNWNIQEDGILTHCSARYHRETDREVPIIYGDYFLLEGILRLLDKDFLIF